MPRKKIENEDVQENTIDTKKIIKDIEKQLHIKQEDIIKNIIDKVDEQINLRVNKKMKEEEKKIVRGKNMKIIRRDIIIVLLSILVGYFGYCLFDVDYFNIRTKIVEVPVDAVEKEDQSKKEEQYNSEYYIKEYRYLVDNMQINDEDIFDLYNDVSKDTISNKLKLKIAYRNLDTQKREIAKETITFKSEDLLQTAKSIFGESVKLDNEIFSYNNTKFLFYNDIYLGFINKEEDIDFVYEIYDARKSENNLFFDVSVSVLNEDTKGTKKFEYSFSKEEDNYVFESIKKI